MCVICVKRAGVEMPDEETIERMWDQNPDGAGFMWADKGLVHVRKGFMRRGELEEALREIPDPVNRSVILHFRITTHGGTCPENTHPFEICDDPERLKRTSFDTERTCFAHNGVLLFLPRRKDLSDTMEYALSRLAPLRDEDPDFLHDGAAMARIAAETEGSRLAFLDRRGRIETTGRFHKDPETGLEYSKLCFGIALGGERI